eukprot:50081_1
MATEALDISTAATHWVVLSLTGVYALVLTPLSLYYARAFWILNTQNIPFITKRVCWIPGSNLCASYDYTTCMMSQHPRVVILSVLVFNAYIVIIRPVSDLTALYGLQLGLEPLSTIGLFVITLRVWLLFYDYNHALHTLSLKWQTQITHESPHKIPWTSRYKWMGDVKTLFVITAVVCIAVLTATILCHFVFGSLASYYIRIVVGISIIIFMIILIFNVRSCRDGFYIQKEFKLLMACMAISTVLFAAIDIVFERDSNIQLLAANLRSSITYYILSFMQTHYVIKHYVESGERGAKFVHARSLSARMSSHRVNDVENKLSLEEILKTRDGFDVFANHLIREFSTENLFFLYEVMQVKNEMLMKNLVKKEDIGFMVSFDSQSMRSIRRADSTINDVNDLRKTVRYFIEQYIESSGQYCINLSAQNRVGMMQAYHQLEGGGKLVVEAAIDIIYDGEDSQCEADHQTSNSIDFGKINDLELNKQYIVLFDDAMREIVFLLKSDSLRRFYQTDEYITMIQNSENIQ